MPGIPTHGPWCATRTWPTDCSICGQQVFYFSCSCGSGVFFDHLGRPWPIHRHGDDDDSASDGLPPWAADVIRRIESDGAIIAEVEAMGFCVIRRPAAGAGSLAAPARRHPTPRSGPRRGRRQPDPIIAVPPGASEQRAIVGILRELDRSIDPMRPFGYSDDGPIAIAMAQAWLGSRWAARLGRITVHTPSSDTPGQLESYTAWVPDALIASRRIRRNLTVSASLTGVDASDRVRIWFCDFFRTL